MKQYKILFTSCFLTFQLVTTVNGFPLFAMVFKKTNTEISTRIDEPSMMLGLGQTPIKCILGQPVDVIKRALN